MRRFAEFHSSMLNQRIFWVILFTFLLTLSMDFWQWENKVRLSWLGFPGWVFYFIVIQGLLALAIYAFGVRFYKNKGEKRE